MLFSRNHWWPDIVSPRRLFVSELSHFVYFVLSVSANRKRSFRTFKSAQFRCFAVDFYPSASPPRSTILTERVSCFWRIKRFKEAERQTNMSADQQLFLSPCPPFPLGGVEAESSPQSEMETLRMLVNERLTAAVDDILGVFVKTVARYREQIDRQRRQLDSLRSEEGKWNHSAGRFVQIRNVLTRLYSDTMKIPLQVKVCSY